MHRTSSLALGEHVHALKDAILKALVVLEQVVDAGVLIKPAPQQGLAVSMIPGSCC